MHKRRIGKLRHVVSVEPNGGRGRKIEKNNSVTFPEKNVIQTLTTAAISASLQPVLDFAYSQL